MMSASATARSASPVPGFDGWLGGVGLPGPALEGPPSYAESSESEEPQPEAAARATRENAESARRREVFMVRVAHSQGPGHARRDPRTPEIAQKPGETARSCWRRCRVGRDR